LQQKGHLLSPGLLHTQVSQLGFDFSKLIREVLDGSQILPRPQPLNRREFEALPPRLLLCRPQLPVRGIRNFRESSRTSPTVMRFRHQPNLRDHGSCG